jgi:hypothetical protein
MPKPDTSEAFRRLVPFSWRGELLLICCGMLLSFLIAGFWYPYWRIADMDFFVVYNAFLLNVPLPQEFFYHPGYLSILLLSYWLRALHALGIVDLISLSALPPASDAAAFTQAWTTATRAGRVLSLIYAMGFVVAFAHLLRVFIRDWRIAAFGAFLLAFSGGMAMQMRIMRTELLAAAFFFCALLMLFIIAQHGDRWWRPVVIGCASLLITLAMLNKIQFLFPICALPFLPLPFGAHKTERGFWHNPRRAWPLLGVFIAVTAVAALLAKDILLVGFFGHGEISSVLVPLQFGAGLYWPAMVVWIALGMIAFAIIWRVSAVETLAAMFAAVAGCMISLLALYIRYDINNVIVVFHPLEQMARFALDADRVTFLFEAVGGVIARRTFFLSSSPRPTIFLEWLVIAATVIAIRRREWKLVLQISVLMLADWSVDTFSMARWLKQEYFLLADPLVIIAAALVVAKLTDLQRHRLTYPIGATLIAAHIVVSQAEPVKHIFRTGGPEELCQFYNFTPRLERLPVCGRDPATLLNKGR